MHGLNALRVLAEEYRDCELCPLLCRSREQVVFGSGSASADIMVIGEAPGETEDEEGIPFVGESGKMLLQLLEKVWKGDEVESIRQISDNDEYYRRMRDLVEERVFFTNTVLCLPDEGRTPNAREIKACRDRLHKTIYAVDPQLIIALGNTAATAVLGKKISVLKRRGDIFDISVSSPVTGKMVRYPMMALMHPSYLLRTGSRVLVRSKKGETYKTIGDLRYAMSLVNEYNDLAGR